MSWREKFTEHPATVGESYGEHMAMAGSFAARLFVAAAACAIHAVLPFLFQRTGSTIIAELHERMVVNRSRHARSAHPEPVLARPASD